MSIDKAFNIRTVINNRNTHSNQSNHTENFKCFNCNSLFFLEERLLLHYHSCLYNNNNEQNRNSSYQRQRQVEVASSNIPIEILEENPFSTDILYNFLDWKLERLSKGVNFWKFHKEIKFSKEEIEKISKISKENVEKSDFLTKRIWFNSYIANNIYDSTGDSITLVINRSNILSESYFQFKTTENLNLTKEIKIFFVDEQAQDVGGVYKEWYSCLLKEIFSVELRLFYEVKNEFGCNSFFIPIGKTSLQGNVEFDEGIYYFIGQVLGKGVYDKNLLSYNLNYILLKLLLYSSNDNDNDDDNEKMNSISICLDDIKYLDYEVSSKSIYYTYIHMINTILI